MKIKGRDVWFFFLGILTIFVIETAMDWEGSKESSKKGFYESFEKK